MLQHRRCALIFICSIIFLQAIYYKTTLLKGKTQIPILIYSDPGLNLQTSDSSTLTTTVSRIQLFSKDSSPFANISFELNFTKPDRNIYDTLPICHFSIDKNQSYRVKIQKDIYPFDFVERTQGNHLQAGGHWFPTSCRSEQRLALIICYRNRENHLKLFLNNIHSFLKQQQLDYTIFVVNQHGQEQFNRAALFNVGYLEAMKLYSFDCFIFHDVDLLPEDLRNLYKCGDRPRHMSVAVDKFNYRLLYSTLFGGVTAFSLADFIGARGYPNVYWGWGGEDDDMYLRVKRKLKKTITRYPIDIARYVMIRRFNHVSGRANPHRHQILYSKYDYDLDGFNSTKYQLHDLRFYRLFTLVNVSLVEETYPQIRRRLNIKPKKRT